MMSRASVKARTAVACGLLVVGLVLCAIAVVAPTGGAALGVVLVGACCVVVGGDLVVTELRGVYGRE
jgi:hypothetical protein